METRTFQARDGAQISYRDAGSGRPVLLLHGYIADAAANWIAPGVSKALTEAGFRVLMPDLRGHGASVISHDARDFPRDAYALDQLDLLESLSIDDYDLVGYSLGAMVAARVQALDGRARSLVLSGNNDDGLLDRDADWAPFLAALADPDAARGRRGLRGIIEFVETVGGDCEALRLGAECREATSAEELAAFRCRTLLLSGSDDEFIEGLEPLQKLVPGSRIARTPGDHLSAVSKPEFASALVEFLSEDTP